MKVTLDLPEIEGFEPDEGKQPRNVKFGEYYLSLETLEPKSWDEVRTSFDHAIILKKKAPAYEFIYRNTRGNRALVKFDSPDDNIKYVEIKALEDAFQMIERMNSNPEMMAMECDEYAALKELIK